MLSSRRGFDRKCFGFVTLIYLNRREYFIVVKLIYVNFINYFSLYLFQYLFYLLLIFIFALFSFGLSLSGSLKKIDLIVSFICSFLDNSAVSNRQLRPRFPSGEGGLIRPLC